MMAQLVKLEPGDILVLANVDPGVTPEEIETFTERMTWLKDLLELSHVIVFSGDVDFSALPAGWTPDAVAGS